MYHSTTPIDAATRTEYERIAKGQEAAVLNLFRSRFPARLSPEDVQLAVLPHAPITSVRRAISDLTRGGWLRKCAEQVIGEYGRPIHVWELASDGEQMTLF